MLEDNRVLLSSMRSNRYHLYFATEIIKWDKDLSLLSETVEMIIQVLWLISQPTCCGKVEIVVNSTEYTLKCKMGIGSF